MTCATRQAISRTSHSLLPFHHLPDAAWHSVGLNGCLRKTVSLVIALPIQPRQQLSIAQPPLPDVCSCCMRRHPGNICWWVTSSCNENVSPYTGSQSARTYCLVPAGEEHINGSFAVDSQGCAAVGMRNGLQHGPCLSPKYSANPGRRHSVGRGSNNSIGIERNEGPASATKQRRRTIKHGAISVDCPRWCQQSVRGHHYPSERGLATCCWHLICFGGLKGTREPVQVSTDSLNSSSACLYSLWRMQTAKVLVARARN